MKRGNLELALCEVASRCIRDACGSTTTCNPKTKALSLHSNYYSVPCIFR